MANFFTRARRYVLYRALVWCLWVVLVTFLAAGLSYLGTQEEEKMAIWLGAAFVLGVFLIADATQAAGEGRIDTRLSEVLGWVNLKTFRSFTKSFPSYRFVDLFRAVDAWSETFPECTILEARQDVDLNTIINSGFYSAEQAKIRLPTKVPKAVAYKEELYFPTDQFWAVLGPESEEPRLLAILRVKISEYTRDILLEIATNIPDKAEEITEEIIEQSIKNSIYRNKLLQVSFEAGIHNEYGEVEGGGEVNLSFKKEKPVDREDIVLDDEIGEMLERNIFDFHRKREELKKWGIPCKKGVLFYGPPGTGKTFTCQYIYSHLKPVTTLVVTGQSLLQVKSICNLARMLQPSLLVLEDVDLIFSAREINLYSTALGDLMDELDGFQKDESVTFLLTTNAIERLEAAIKDRPGRINQCIYFGHPNAELRKRYIKRYLRDFDFAQVDLDHVVDLSKGCSQAFIKELIYRAVQISLERPETNGQSIHLIDKDFDHAMQEMTRYNEQAAGAIMGFRVSG